MTKAEFLEICSQHWEDLQNLHRHDNLYDFEKDFEQIARELSRESFEGVLGNVPMDYRKKSLHDLLRESLHIQSKLLSKSLKDCRLSPLLKERVGFLDKKFVWRMQVS